MKFLFIVLLHVNGQPVILQGEVPDCVASLQTALATYPAGTVKSITCSRIQPTDLSA